MGHDGPSLRAEPGSRLFYTWTSSISFQPQQIFETYVERLAHVYILVSMLVLDRRLDPYFFATAGAPRAQQSPESRRNYRHGGPWYDEEGPASPLSTGERK
jgi:hypothetical protein